MATRLTSDQRREHLLHTGVALLGRHGTADVSIEEIAQAAGVSKGLLYHYFPTKDAFLLAVLARSQSEMDEEEVRDRALSPMAQFDRNLDGFLSFVDEHALGYLAVVNARGRSDAVRALIEERRARRVDELVALVALMRGTGRDEVRTPQLVAAIEGWLGFSEGVVVRWLRDREVTQAEVRELMRCAFVEATDCALSLTTPD
jgi:AcrR family transcriptional regulator